MIIPCDHTDNVKLVPVSIIQGMLFAYFEYYIVTMLYFSDCECQTMSVKLSEMSTTGSLGDCIYS